MIECGPKQEGNYNHAGRRRLERDLHDGVQQELVGVLARLGLARNQLPRDRDIGEKTIREAPGRLAARGWPADPFEGAAYFFVSEALTNVLKHANACSTSSSGSAVGATGNF